jgi:hypothetical protein
MYAPNRRLEKRLDIFDNLKIAFEIHSIKDFSFYEDENKFMEGTGSVVFDHIAKKAYLCLSERSDKNIFEEICAYLGYQAVSFTATDSAGMLIYHTNVLMCITDKLVIICLEAVKDTDERDYLHNSLANSGKIIVEISLSQMANFAGNMLGLMASNETPPGTCLSEAVTSIFFYFRF